MNKRDKVHHSPFLEVPGSIQRRWKEVLPLVKLEVLMIIWEWEFLINKLFLEQTDLDYLLSTSNQKNLISVQVLLLGQWKDYVHQDSLKRQQETKSCLINSIRLIALSKLFKLLIPHL